MANLKTPEPLSEDVQRALEELRTEHNLRALTAEESGSGVDTLPDGVYGFTYSPALENFPLFKDRDLRCYEGHKRTGGDVVLLGFLSESQKAIFESASETATIHLFAEPKDDANRLVSVPMTRVVGHVEYSQRGGQGLELSINAAS